MSGDRRSLGAPGGGPTRRLAATAARRHRRCSLAIGIRFGGKHEARAPTRCAHGGARTTGRRPAVGCPGRGAPSAGDGKRLTGESLHFLFVREDPVLNEIV